MMKSPKAQDSSKDLKVTVYWGDILYDTLICRPNESVTIGPAEGSTYVLDLGKAHAKKSLEIVKVFPGSVAEFRYDDGVMGHVRLGDKMMSLVSAKNSPQVKKDENGIYNVTLTRQDKADVVLGHVSFYLDWIDQSEVIERDSLKDKKKSILLALLLCFGTLLVGVLLYLIPVAEPEKPPERLVTLVSKSGKAKAAAGSEKSADGGAQKGDAGKAASTPVQKTVSAAEKLRSANLGSLANSLTSLSGSEAPNVDSRQSQSSAAAQPGGTGFSTEGLKAGGGGKTVGIGRTVGQGEGGFQGTGKLGLSGDSLVEGGSGHGGSGTGNGDGGLDRDVIESIIRRRQDRIRLCYERQLNFNPKLAGKVAVHFVIGKTGSVIESSIAENTMRNPMVSSCILSEVKTWTFPAPMGGVNVVVDYPFVFESSVKNIK